MNKNYVPLYRKYRPQTLEQVVGQEHIKKALANAIETDRISHAYLFTGPRGTGKTSTARIFAKSLNCEKGPTISPCNECENCKNITNSIPIDVIEIDAASNRSVSDAEEIIQNVAMSPVHSRYKIYIIDEVHMLSTTAFNALLKTLEEPPENVIFILATTEVHKVLDTIKSRCQRFDFKRITTDDIAKHLRYISDQENINIDEDALRYIAQNSAGGMRDSIALLDQLSVLNSADSQITVDDINRLLGRLSFDSLTSLFEAVSVSDQNDAIEKLNEIYDSGNEPSQILSNFLDYLRNALIVKSVENSPENIVQLNSEQLNILKEKVMNIETHQIVSLIDKCAEYIKELKLSSNPKLWLDIAILDMANLTQNTKLEDLNKRISALESGTSRPMNVSSYNTPPSPVMKPEVKRVAKTMTQKNENTDEAPKTSQKENPIPQPAKMQASANSASSDLWVQFLNGVSSFPSRAILKQQAIPVKLSADEIIIAIKTPTWLSNFGPEGERHAFLVESAQKLFGTAPKIIVRSPQPGDDKLRSEAQAQNVNPEPKKPLIVENNTPEKVVVEDAISQVEDSDDDLDFSEDEEISEDQILDDKKKIEVNPKSDSTFHSDNVNMVMDLFEGKLIE